MGSTPQTLRLAVWLLVAAELAPPKPSPIWIEPCAGDVERESACHAGDVELSRWAVAAWEHERLSALFRKP